MVRIAVKLGILFVLVYAGVSLWYGRLEKRLFVPSEVVPQQAAVETPAEKPSQDLQKAGNYQIIVARNIFEAVLEQKKVKAEDQKPAPVVEKEPEETKLKLVLHGTVSGREQDARAIIIDQKQKRQELYEVGDSIQGALITSIERGKVILELNGKKQLLVIKDPEGGGGRGSGGRTSGAVSRPRTANPNTSFSRERTSSPPRAVPHRRISFRQNKAAQENGEPIDVEEPEEPLMGEVELFGEEAEIFEEASGEIPQDVPGPPIPEEMPELEGPME